MTTTTMPLTTAAITTTPNTLPVAVLYATSKVGKDQRDGSSCGATTSETRQNKQQQFMVYTIVTFTSITTPKIYINRELSDTD
jgi:hypothetical protein